MNQETFNKIHEEAREYREEFGIDIMKEATMLARDCYQNVGEKNDYYITLEQLEEIIKKLNE